MLPVDLPGPGAHTGPGAHDGRATRWQSHREERRRELIKSARKAVHALGSDASMEDIAAASGTSKSVFYRYFGDKAGLQQAVGEVVLSQMQRRIQEAAEGAQTPRQGLFAMVSAYLQMAETSPNVYTFVTRHAYGEPGTAADAGAGALGHFFAAISDMIARPMRGYLGAGPEQETVLALLAQRRHRPGPERRRTVAREPGLPRQAGASRDGAPHHRLALPRHRPRTPGHGATTLTVPAPPAEHLLCPNQRRNRHD